MNAPLANWNKYETRSLLPHYLCARYALVVGVTLADLFNVDGALPKK